MSEITKFVNHCEKDTCIVDLRNIGGMDWDSLYCFNEHENSNTIGLELRVKYYSSNVPENHFRIILLKNGKVVYEEDVSRHSEPEVQFLEKNWMIDQYVKYSVYDWPWYCIRERSIHSGKIFYSITPISAVQ